jgi:hypothetical protein
MKAYWSLEKQEVIKAVGDKACDAVVSLIPLGLDALNSLLFMVCTQVNKIFFGAHHHIVDLFAHSMHKIINLLCGWIEQGVKDYQAEKELELCADHFSWVAHNLEQRYEKAHG